MLEEINFDDDVKLLSFDFNFVTTINRALHCKALNSINFILEKVYVDRDYPEYYYNLVMLDLIRMLHNENVNFGQFFSKVSNQKFKVDETPSIISFERILDNHKLSENFYQKENVQWLEFATIFSDVREQQLISEIKK